MSRPSPLPFLLRTISLVGVGAWLGWQLWTVSMGLSGFTPGSRTLVFAGITLVSTGLGIRYLGRTRAGGWQRTDAPLLMLALVLLLFESLIDQPQQRSTDTSVTILPWSVTTAGPGDAQLANVLEEAWRQRLWEQNQWRPVIFFDPGTENTLSAQAVQTRVVVQNQKFSVRVSVGAAAADPDVFVDDAREALLFDVSETASASGAILLAQALDALNRQFAPNQEDPTAIPLRPMSIAQPEIDCALMDQRVQDHALQSLRDLVFQEPDSALQHAALANCALRIFRLTPKTGNALRHEARASANRAIRLQPSLSIAQSTAASVAWQLDANPMKAEGLWRRVLDTFPGQAGIRLDLAGMYFSAGLTPNAMSEVDHARVTAPDHPRAAYLQALAALEPQSGGQNYRQAVTLLETVVRIAPDSDEYRLALALAYQLLGETRQVLEPFPVSQYPDQNPDSLAYRSWWLATIGDHAGAQVLRDRLFQQGDRGPGRAFRLALVAKGRGQAEASDLALSDARRNADPRLLWPVTRLLFDTEPAMMKLSADWQAALQSTQKETDPT